MQKRIHLSIVIPVYNEEKRLKSLKKVFAFLERQEFGSELIVVNDGSTDKTQEKLRLLQGRYPLLLVTYRSNRGKGYAIRRGMLKARGRHRLFLDVDLSTPLKEFEKMVPFLETYEVIIGSRKMKGAKLRKRQPIIRQTLGRVFTQLSRWILNVPVSDFTCGFKCFSARSTRNIFSRAQINRWGFDSEILFLAKKMGHQIKEVPVEWKNDINTKVRFPHDIVNSLKELLEVRKNEILGRYN